MPHDVTGDFRTSSENNLEIIQVKCSCAAGASECCKHVVSILLYLNRYTYSIIEIYF